MGNPTMTFVGEDLEADIAGHRGSDTNESETETGGGGRERMGGRMIAQKTSDMNPDPSCHRITRVEEKRSSESPHFLSHPSPPQTNGDRVRKVNRSLPGAKTISLPPFIPPTASMNTAQVHTTPPINVAHSSLLSHCIFFNPLPPSIMFSVFPPSCLWLFFANLTLEVDQMWCCEEPTGVARSCLET